MKLKTRVNKLLSILLAMAVMICIFAVKPQTVDAATADQIAFQINQSFSHGGTGPISASNSGGTVTVTGKVSGVQNTLTLNLDSKVNVVWKAKYSGNNLYPLVELTGGGTFEVVTGGSIANSGGDAIYSSGTNSKILVSGGDVSSGAVERSAIFAGGNNSVITVSGGTLGASAKKGYAVCTAGTNTKITVGGGMLRATGEGGSAIYIMGGSGTAININGGTVESTKNWAIYNTGYKCVINVTNGTIKANCYAGRAIRNAGEEAKITVSGGTLECGDEGISIANATGGSNSEITVTNGMVKASGVNSTAIYNADTCPNCKITVSGGTVQSVYRGIFNAGANSSVTVKGGEVAGTTGRAIQNDSANSSVTVSSGFVFAYGASTSGSGNETAIRMASGSPTIHKAAVVCAYNHPALAPTYTAGSSTNLSTSPSAAKATWGLNGAQTGIYYKNGVNSGFFPIGGITVNEIASAVPELGYWRSTLLPMPEDNAVASDDKFVGFFQENGNFRLEYGIHRTSHWIGGEITAAVNTGGNRTELTMHIPATPADEVNNAMPERWETIYIHKVDNYLNIKIEGLSGVWYTFEWGGNTLQEAFGS